MTATLVIHPATKAEMDDMMDSMKLESERNKERLLQLIWLPEVVEVYLQERKINGNLPAAQRV